MKFRWIPKYGFRVSLDSSLLVEISGGCVKCIYEYQCMFYSSLSGCCLRLAFNDQVRFCIEIWDLCLKGWCLYEHQSMFYL